MAHSRPTALEIQTEYVDTMSKIYYSYFKDYHSKLLKLQVCKYVYIKNSLSFGVLWNPNSEYKIAVGPHPDQTIGLTNQTCNHLTTCADQIFGRNSF